MFSRSAAAYTLILVLALAGCGGQLKNREAGVGSGGDDTFPDGSNLSGGSGGGLTLGGGGSNLGGGSSYPNPGGPVIDSQNPGVSLVNGFQGIGLSFGFNLGVNDLAGGGNLPGAHLTDQWHQFTVLEPAVFLANNTVSFSYSNGGGGTALIDLQRWENGDWVGTEGVHCGSDTYIQPAGATQGVEASARCQQVIAPGTYRARGYGAPFASTSVNYYNGTFSLIRALTDVAVSGALQNDQWVEFAYTERTLLSASGSVSFSYSGGGGGSVVLDLQAYVDDQWVSPDGSKVLHCGSDTSAQGKGSAVADASASCQRLLEPGRYRVKAQHFEYSGTSVNYFSGNFTVLKLCKPGVSGGGIGGGTLPHDQWQEFSITKPGVLVASNTVSMTYSNGGGGSAVIDVERLINGSWVAQTPGHCGSDSYGQTNGQTQAVEASASCQVALDPGIYRVRGRHGEFAGTGVNYYSGSFVVMAR